MAEEVGAVALQWGPMRLVLGDEDALTAAELAGSGDAVRIGIGELDSLGSDGLGSPGEVVAITTVALDGTPTDSGLSIDALGLPKSGLLGYIESLDEAARLRAVVESALVSWRLCIADISDALGPINMHDSETLGPIPVLGRPLLSDLLAAARMPVGRGERVDFRAADIDAVGAVIAELDASIGFALAGLEAAGDDFGPRLLSAVESGGWHQKLRLLLAAEEVHAVALLSVVRAAGPEELQEVGVEWVMSRRRIATTVAERLARIDDRIRAGGLSPTWRTAKRKREAIGAVIVTCEVYGAALAPAVVNNSEFESNWAAIVSDLEKVENAVAVYDATSANAQAGSIPIDEAAELLGEIFARQLPGARELVAEVRQSRPGLTDGEMIRHIKRQFVTRLQIDLANDKDVFEDVALLAMSLAVVRKITPQSDAEFSAIGRRLLETSERIASMHRSAGIAETAVVAGFERYFYKVQPMIVEAVFRALEFAKPGHAGQMRNLYKAARKNVWAARHDRSLGKTVGAGAAKSVRTIANAGAPRLIVRTVDRAITRVE
ncbi:hypothetical protein [Tsukamurella hominis]|uniref:hypothetical protein n=1 Tax=Tsukamurella hominis TaxID=1970232 RepID=UPI0039E9D10F